ncbi:MAG TPA: dienelactone hydrolase family protein [Candidatus Acidoferrum sp.]|nr:dienelactone hydrolase family protein [Candidatus Acidoferrum sp.]
MLRSLLALPILVVLHGCVTATSWASPTITVGSEQIPIAVSRPDGPGPFPAVVIVHDCSGLGPRSSGAPGRWAKELVARGYVVVMPDSFTPRGHPDGVCTTPVAQRRTDVTPAQRARDAHEALAYVRGLPDVDGKRVGIMGGSHGGTTTLNAMMAPDDAGAGDKRGGFAAGVALYPRCVADVYRPVAPVLILIGEKDDWTPAEPCRKLADASRAAGQPVTIKIYPGAHHSFDSARPERYVATRINPNAPGGRGATTGGDPAAWADSIREVAAFFDRHLGPTKQSDKGTVKP